MEYENVIKAIDNLKYINDGLNCGRVGEKEEIENVIEIANSFGYHYTNEDYEDPWWDDLNQRWCNSTGYYDKYEQYHYY